MNINGITVFCIVIIPLVAGLSPVYGQRESAKQKLEEQIREYEEKLAETRKQKDSLSSQVELMDTQIYLTELKAAETEEAITEAQKAVDVLGVRIDKLDSSLNGLSRQLIDAVVEGYKQKEPGIFQMLFSGDDFGTSLLRYKYMKVNQENNQRLLFQVQQTKSNFQDQKKLREEKKKQLDQLQRRLEAQEEELGTQKKAKESLLEQTQNDEQVYQALLEKTKAEYAAIQTIVSGGGDEGQGIPVAKGQVIARIIQGASCNSGGTHLHFITKENGSVVNPFLYLNGSVSINNCSGSGCGTSDGDSTDADGSWDWPITSPVTLTQGYGSTWATRNTWVGRIYGSHNGIDISSVSPEVKAVADGTLYRGTFAGTNGCALSYVRVLHTGDPMETYYLHVR
jgi:septal ring factor EnvC (AmiA/AmiB activator)